MLTKRVLISDVCVILQSYLPKEQIKKVYDAYLFASNAHDGQYRVSKEAYVHHPVAVAIILAKLKLDYISIISAILHDCLEDTTVTKQEIEEKFGNEVSYIVEGVSKLDGLEKYSINEKQAKNFRKLLLAASKDIRVIIIKLADRLHNMYTISHLKRYKQIRIAKETINIYVPIARRLGLNGIKEELKDLCFQTIAPFKYKVLVNKINSKYQKSKNILKQTQDVFNEKLQELNITATISSRRKEISSVYNKMKNKHLKFSEVMDLYAMRIIVDDINNCYQTLGIVHNSYKPIPGKFKDYIALPKNNGYQSLHTIILAYNQIFIEIQIRSKKMDFVAEYGLAAHWYYKNNNDSKITPYWLGNILENQSSENNFLEHISTEFTTDDIFVFTPKGDIIKLPYLSTVLDFAYALHTDIGNKAYNGIINHNKVPLNTKLKSGQMIKIITVASINANLKWLNITITNKAKIAIKNCLHKYAKNSLENEGRKLLTKLLSYNNIKINNKDWSNYLNKLGLKNKEQLFAKIALKEILLSNLLSVIIGYEYKEIINAADAKKNNTKIEPAKCCSPVPGERVFGIVTNYGILLHRSVCINVKNKKTQRIKVDWSPDNDSFFNAKIGINITNQRGVLADIASIIAKLGVNISNININETNNNTILIITVDVNNIKSINMVIKKLLKCNFVQTVDRI